MSDERLLIFDVDGEPEPQGSATAFVPLDRNGFPMARGGRKPDGSYRKGSVIVNVTSDNPDLKKWRKAVAQAAREAMEAAGLATITEKVSLAVEAHFFMERPEGEWGTGRNARHLKANARAAPVVIPDVDKLARAALDGMSEIVYKDDAVVTRLVAEEHYAVPDGSEYQGVGVTIAVYRRAAQTAADLPNDQVIRWVPARDGEGSEDAPQLALTP